MPIPKPSSHLDWTDGDPSKVTEPSTSKKLLGWIAGERPPFQFMNFLFFRIDEWLKWAESAFEGSQQEFDVVVGSGDGATHATLADAVADGTVGPDTTVWIADSDSLDSTVQLTKSNWRIKFAPGVTYSKGTATTGIQVSASGIEIMHGRFTGFSASGDKALESDSSGSFGKVLFARFFDNDTSIDDSAAPAGEKPVALGNIWED